MDNTESTRQEWQMLESWWKSELKGHWQFSAGCFGLLLLFLVPILLCSLFAPLECLAKGATEETRRQFIIVSLIFLGLTTLIYLPGLISRRALEGMAELSRNANWLPDKEQEKKLKRLAELRGKFTGQLTS